LLSPLGLISGDEAPSEATLEAYHRMFEMPLTDEMIEAVGELYGWSLCAIKGCVMPSMDMSGGRLLVACIRSPQPGVPNLLNVVRPYGVGV